MRARTALISIDSSSSRARVESIEYLEPYLDAFGPPDRLNDMILRVLPDDLFLIAGHSSRRELFQEWTVGDE